MTEPLRVSFEVAASQRHAFATWTERFGAWWPPSHTVSGRAGALVELQGRVGGEIGEVLPDGSRVVWGEVTAWAPPEELGYDWHFGRDAAEATRVRVRFVAVDVARTRIDIEHGGWEVLGAEAGTWRERNVAGWNGMLPHYVAAVEGADS